jgi:hypothetical protein
LVLLVVLLLLLLAPVLSSWPWWDALICLFLLLMLPR